MLLNEEQELEQDALLAQLGIPPPPRPDAKTKNAKMLEALRALVDAGAPQKPVVSGSRQPVPQRPMIGGRSRQQVNWEQELPLNDTEPLAQHGLFNALFAPGATKSKMPSMEDVGSMSPVMGVAGPSTAAAKSAMRTMLDEAFPTFDAYAKKKGFLQPQTVLERLLAHPSATPDMIAKAEAMVANGQKLKPAEVVDVLSGVKHDRGRVLRKGVSQVTKENIPGAPLWVTSPAKEREALEGYLKLMEEGAPGRKFYRDSGAKLFHLSGENADTANLLGTGASATSPTTSVGANTGFMFKGHGQAVAGVPVKTGRFPGPMSKPITAAHAGDNSKYLGPKRDPFVRQIAMGGDYATPEQMTDRAVHDIWEGEAWKYVEPDGTPIRRGFTPAEHQWMDKMTDQALAEANKRQVAGFTDWDAGTGQASTWTGAKIRAGDIEPGDAAKSFADYTPRYEMQMGRESRPGTSTGHLAGLKDLPPAAQQEYHDGVMAITLDAKGRDRSWLEKGLPSEGSTHGPGVFENEISPGTQVKNIVGTEGSGKTRQVEAANMGLARANEAEYALLNVQNAMAGNMPNVGALAAERDMFDLAKPSGKLAEGDDVLTHPRIQQELMAGNGGNVAVMPIDQGARVKNIGMPQADFASLMKQLTTDTNGKSIAGRDMGFYENLPWNTPDNEVGQLYARIIRDEIPNGKALFNKSAPARAQARHDYDAQFATKYNLPVNEKIQELRRAIAQHGFDGVNLVAKKYGLPLAAVMLMLQQAMGEELAS